MDRITTINDKIDRLRKQKSKIQMQEAVLFRHEAEKIFGNNFSPDMTLAVMSDWTAASETKKKEWTNKSNSFRTVSLRDAQRKAEADDASSHQSEKATTS